MFKFTTPFGLFRFNRLVMGAHTASGECHAKLSEVLTGLRGVVQIKDDICVHGKGEEHDRRLLAVLHRFAEYGITLREEKCKFGQQEVMWFGHTFHRLGMSPDPSKVETIKAWPAPEDKAAVKSFLQTVQFCAPFMRVGPGETYSDITAPLRRLTAHGTHFKWTKECQTSFIKMKSMLNADTVLVNYDPARKTRLYVDHGPKGVAATVAQKYDVVGQREPQYRAVYHSSRSLTKAEMGYSKVEGESLGVMTGCKTNSRFLYGTEFEVITDHLPLVPLYNNSTRPAPARVERHRSKLRSFQFKMKYEPGRLNPSDYSSRHPPPPRAYTQSEKEELGVEEEDDDAVIQVGRLIMVGVDRVTNGTLLEAVTLEQVQEAMRGDRLMKKLVKAVQTGQDRAEMGKSVYGKVLTELSYAQGVLVRGDRVVIPDSLLAEVIALAHEGHPGIELTLRNLRDRVWFPNMNKLVTEYVATCLGCTAAVPHNPPAPIVNRETPEGPWKVCAADYKGPIGGNRGYYFHVLVDTYSKWPEVTVTKSTKFEKLYPELDKSFACHGYPDKIIHDGGPPYNSQQWKDYAKRSGFETDLCTPEHPQANGQAEKMMSSIVKLTHASISEDKDPKEEITKFLLMYRNTPHSSTGQSPASLMMERKIKTKLPTIIAPPTSARHQQAQEKDSQSKAKHKAYADRHRRARHRLIQVGDKVLVKQSKTTTKPPYDPDYYFVKEVRGTKITGERRGKIKTRNVEKWKLLKERPTHLNISHQPMSDGQEETDTDSDFEFEVRSEQVPLDKEGQNLLSQEEGGTQPHTDNPAEPDQEHTTAPAQEAAQPKQPCRERWEVAAGPWRLKPASPGPRERRRRQQVARKRDKKTNNSHYWLRGQEQQSGEGQAEEEEEETV